MIENYLNIHVTKKFILTPVQLNYSKQSFKGIITQKWSYIADK